MIDYQEIGNNIKICRIRCNLKQAELAEMVGVTSQHISHVERCQTKPSLTLMRVKQTMKNEVSKLEGR